MAKKKSIAGPYKSRKGEPVRGNIEFKKDHSKIFEAINRLTKVVREGPSTYSPKSSETKYRWGAAAAIERLVKRVLK